MSNKQEMLDLQETCRVLGIQSSDLEAIESEGLITLEVIQGRKVVTGEQLERLRMIMRLKRDLAVNLPGIDVILQMRSRMIQMRVEVEQILDFLHTQLSRDIRELLGEEDFPLALGSGDEFMAIGGMVNGNKVDIDD